MVSITFQSFMHLLLQNIIIEIINKNNEIFIAFLLSAASLTCFRCVSGRCQTSSTYFGTVKTCNGFDPVCIRQSNEDGEITRDCQYSFNYAPLKGLDGQCIEFKGKHTCYCTGDKCNSSLENKPVTLILVLAFTVSMFWLSLFR